MLKNLIEKMAKALVDDPDQVQVSEIVTDYTLMFEIKVAKDDMGQVIGKHGRNAQAMRTILIAAAAAAGFKKNVILEIPD